jgi:SulP family sulfate permease
MDESERMRPRNIIRGRETRAARLFGGAALAQDVVAGLTLAAIAVPEQMATARLGHFPPEIGFVAFIAGTLGFAVLGRSRTMSVGADSTITPIFAASLALVAAAGSPAYPVLAAMLALLVGLLVGGAGLCRMGWISNLLSAPVTAGFLAGISVHILASQLPIAFGLSLRPSDTLTRLAQLAQNLGQANPYAIALAGGVLIATAAAEKLGRRWPGALIGVAAATLATLVFSLERRNVQVLGVIAPPIPHLPHAWPTTGDLAHLAPLALLLAMVVMVQSAATTRSFPADANTPPDIDRDFVGVGFGNLVSGLAGAFPVNASPPRTAVATEAGARSKAAGLIAACAVGLLAAFGSSILAHVPEAALAGVLLFVALRIVQLHVALTVWRESKGEFALIVATALAIIVLPIATGVAIGILLSLLHGMWTTTRAQVISLGRVPGTSIWWPQSRNAPVPNSNGVLVLAFQAPLSFLNANVFRRGFTERLARAPAPLRLVVLEASNIADIDFTAAHALKDVVEVCRSRTLAFAIARLESVRAQESFERFGIIDLVGSARVFHSVQQAVDALAPG